MYEFGIPSKLISMTKVCMNGTKYQVRVDNVLSEEFQVVTGLKQGDALSPLLFNIALEKVVRSIQRDNYGIDIDTNKIGILGFTDDLNIVGDDGKSVAQSTTTLINEAKTIGLNVNDNKTKVMELLPENNHVDNIVIQGHTFEKAEKASFSLTKYLKSKLFSRRTKVHLFYTTIIRPTLTYGCEVWPLTFKMEQKLMSFENKILRIICGPVYDNDLGCWRRRTNKETRDLTGVQRITNFVKTQRIKWFGHVMRRSNSDYLKAAVEWKPTGKRPRGRPKKR
ncbi:Reverse transcriptase domain [Cinara cedri]|uniref:Reverse transcriptase domain n=1 Tax=Cinara cedri TaxID=506608 RepID=A0A5E4MK46_9HEMI|nr:Reverse transcriptase domain [Cinara cedri]